MRGSRRLVQEIADEVKHSAAHFTIFCRVRSCLRSSHIPSVFGVQTRSLVVFARGDTIAPVPLSTVRDVLKLLRLALPVRPSPLKPRYLMRFSRCIDLSHLLFPPSQHTHIDSLRAADEDAISSGGLLECQQSACALGWRAEESWKAVFKRFK